MPWIPSANKPNLIAKVRKLALHTNRAEPRHNEPCHRRNPSNRQNFDARRALCYLGNGQFNARHSSVAQWQSIRLLTEGL